MARSTAMQAQAAAAVPVPDALAAPTAEVSPAPQVPEHAEAAAYLDQPCFQRRLTLPATADHGPLTVTYGVAGAQSDSAPTVLFIAGMFGGRYLATFGDFLSKQLGLRFVVVDRPGMGGSTRVDVSQRIAVWLETVPVLMKELNVEHLSIMSHSCGVIYALNTLYAYPDILPPSNPTLHLLSPWVHPQHSGVALMKVSSMIPSPIINHFNSVVSFAIDNVVPSFAFSSGLVSSATSALSPSRDPSDQTNRPKHERDDLCRECHGVPATVVAARVKEMMRRLWKEDTTGGNQEALLCLKKPEVGSWRVCDDYEKLPRELEARWAQRSGQSNTEEPDTARPLRISVYWAETDMLVGKKGEIYFDNCFRDHCGEQSRVEYRSETMAESDHETLCHPQYGALPEALREVAGRK